MAEANETDPQGTDPPTEAPRRPEGVDVVPCGAQPGKDRCWCMACQALAPAPELPMDTCLCERGLRSGLAAQGNTGW